MGYAKKCAHRKDDKYLEYEIPLVIRFLGINAWNSDSFRCDHASGFRLFLENLFYFQLKDMSFDF